MKKIFKWALFAVIIVLAVGYFMPKKSPPLMWTEKANIVGEEEITSTAYVTLSGEKVEIVREHPNTFVITSRHADFAFGKLFKTTDVKVGCYKKDGELAIEETLTLKEVGDPRKGEFTSKKIAEFLRDHKGSVRLSTELTDGNTLVIEMPTWASRRPIRAKRNYYADKRKGERTY